MLAYSGISSPARHCPTVATVDRARYHLGLISLAVGSTRRVCPVHEDRHPDVNGLDPRTFSHVHVSVPRPSTIAYRCHNHGGIRDFGYRARAWAVTYRRSRIECSSLRVCHRTAACPRPHRHPPNAATRSTLSADPFVSTATACNSPPPSRPEVPGPYRQVARSSDTPVSTTIAPLVRLRWPGSASSWLVVGDHSDLHSGRPPATSTAAVSTRHPPRGASTMRETVARQTDV